MLEYLLREYEICFREARSAYGHWKRMRERKTLWKEDLGGRVCRANRGVGEKGMEIVLWVKWIFCI